jgi:small-conductance mechanosensitive channel
MDVLNRHPQEELLLMSTTATTIALIFGAGLSVPLWLWLASLVPNLIANAVLGSDSPAIHGVVAFITHATAFVVVFTFGLVVLGLPVLAAAIAGGVIALTVGFGVGNRDERAARY